MLVDTTHIAAMSLAPGGSWSTVYFFPFFSTLRRLTCAAERPFEHFGVGCPNGLGREPRMNWQGIPVQAGSFSLGVSGAEPLGIAASWLGLNDQSWPGVGTLPLDAAPYGAPGCRVYASGEFSLFSLVDSAGRGSVNLTVPVNAALHDVEVFAQSVSSSTGNALRFASSGALSIRIR